MQGGQIGKADSSGRIVFGLCGAGGFGREVMPIIVEHFTRMAAENPGLSYSLYFVEIGSHVSEVNGYPLVSEDEFFQLDCRERYFNVAVGAGKVRERIANAMITRGAKPMTIRSSNAAVYDGNEIGEGAILCANTIITSNARIGRFFHSNLFSYVAHDCVVGDFVTFAPCVHCNGNVHIHNHAYIGTGANIREGKLSKPTVIGEGAVVGMGAVVTKDVPPFTTVVGNPARPLEKPAA